VDHLGWVADVYGLIRFVAQDTFPDTFGDVI
jgi:hypothetical protein